MKGRKVTLRLDTVGCRVMFNRNIEILKNNKKKMNTGRDKVLMQGKLFQRCKHLLYCSVLSLGSI